jgi:hypothetical protein
MTECSPAAAVGGRVMVTKKEPPWSEE